MVWRVADINCYDVIGYQFPRLESQSESECEKGFSELMLVEVQFPCDIHIGNTIDFHGKASESIPHKITLVAERNHLEGLSIWWSAFFSVDGC